MGLLDDLQLDTNYPPTWQNPGTFVLPPGMNPHNNIESIIRPSVRQDAAYYVNFQREQGDLFKRDLMLQAQINLLAQNLGGITFAIPVTRVAPGKSVRMPILTGEISGDPIFTAIKLSLIGCTSFDTPDANYKIQLVDVTGGGGGSVLFTVNSTEKIHDYGQTEILDSSKDYEIRLLNSKTATAITPTTDVNCARFGGFVIVSPQI
jgi:hypothetical protein